MKHELTKQEKINYFAACNKAAKENNLPVEVVMAVGPEMADQLGRFAVDCPDIVKKYPSETKKYFFHELVNTGINRRKFAIADMLQGYADEALQDKIFYLGQVNSERIALFIADFLK